MNNKLTYTTLAELISKATGTSQRMSELFVRELFATVAQRLADGENVTIKGLGTFKIVNVDKRKSVDINTGEAIELSGYKKVSFSPDEALASAINAPFAGFDAVVLEDGVTVDELNAVDTQPSPELAESVPTAEADDADNEGTRPQRQRQPQPTTNPAQSDGLSDSIEMESEADKAPVVPPPFEASEMTSAVNSAPDCDDVSGNDSAAEAEEPAPKQMPEPESETAPEPVPEAREPYISQAQDDEDDEEREEQDEEDDEPWPKRHAFTFGWLTGLATGALITLGTLFLLDFMGQMDINIPAVPTPPKAVAAPIEKVDSVKADSTASGATASGKSVAVTTVAETTAAETRKTVTDTITRKNNLTRLAQKHFGNGHFWVYIYQENKKAIHDPNSLEAGLVLVIPEASKYGIDKDSKQSVDKARRLEYEIMKEYE